MTDSPSPVAPRVTAEPQDPAGGPAPSPTRRHVLRTAGLVALAGGGAATLGACSSDTPAAAPASSPPASSAAPSSSASASASATAPSASASSATPSPSATSKAPSGPSVAAAEVPVGGGVILDDADYVVTQPTRGTYKAFSKICTHQGCPVAEVSDGAIKCDCHGSKFSIKDGSVLQPPADAPLEEAKVTQSGANLVIST